MTLHSFYVSVVYVVFTYDFMFTESFIKGVSQLYMCKVYQEQMGKNGFNGFVKDRKLLTLL